MNDTKDGQPMDLKDDLYLSPFEKYRIYGIFPWGFFLSLLMLVLTTSEVIFVINVNANYSYQQIILWNRIFLNDDADGSDTSLINTFRIFHYEKLISFLRNTTEKYYDINSNTLDNYNYYYTDEGYKKPVKMYLNYVDDHKAKEKGLKTEYDLTLVDIGPFEDNGRQVIDLAESFSIEFKFIHQLDHEFPTSFNCFTWLIIQNYKNTLHGPIKISLDFERGICGGDQGIIYSDFLSKKFFLLHFSVFILSLASISIVFFSVFRRLKILNRFRNRGTIAGVWNSLGLQLRLEFLSFWSLFNFGASLCQMLGAITSIFNGDLLLSTQESSVGFGCFFAWVSIVQYLKPNPNAYTVGNTLSRAVGTLGPYIIGILPIFMAFVFFAMAVLWKTGNYNSLPYSMTLQFAMLNGDSLFSSISVAVANGGIFGLLYTFAFLVFFICVIHNIFIAIISDSYESLKIRPPIVGRYADDEEPESVSMISQNISLQNVSPVKPAKEDRISSIIYLGKQERVAFKKLLDEKILTEPEMNERTNYYIKLVYKTIRKITKTLEKMSKIAAVDDSQSYNHLKIKEKLEDLLLSDLDLYLEKFKTK